jgi:hypothetical protein
VKVVVIAVTTAGTTVAVVTGEIAGIQRDKTIKQ